MNIDRFPSYFSLRVSFVICKVTNGFTLIELRLQYFNEIIWNLCTGIISRGRKEELSGIQHSFRIAFKYFSNVGEIQLLKQS